MHFFSTNRKLTITLLPFFQPLTAFSYFDVYQTESPMLFSYTGKKPNSSFQNHLKAFDALFWSLADDDGLVIKSTRHTADTLYNNRLSPALVTPSTILVHGLLGEVCLEDSDCSILNSVCSDSQRCACQPGTQPFDEGKICKFSSVDTNVPPTVLVGKHCVWKSQKKSQSTLRARFTFWVEKS